MGARLAGGDVKAAAEVRSRQLFSGKLGKLLFFGLFFFFSVFFPALAASPHTFIKTPDKRKRRGRRRLAAVCQMMLANNFPSARICQP